MNGKLYVNYLASIFLVIYSFDKVALKFSPFKFWIGIKLPVGIEHFSFVVHKSGFFIWNSKHLLNQHLQSISLDGNNVAKNQIFIIRKRLLTRLKDDISVDPSLQCSNKVSNLEYCIEDYLQKKGNCTKDDGLLNCSAANDLFNIFNYKENEFFTNTKCKLPCTFAYYEVTSHLPNFVESNNASRSVNLILYADSEKVIHTKEIMIYTSNNLIADVGGYLGLLLGVSIYSLYKGILSFVKTGLKKLLNHNP